MLRKFTALVCVTMAFAVLTSTPAFAGLQSDKNTWRNAAIGSGIIGLYGLHNHQNTTMWLGAAGLGYSLYRYEHDRHEQSLRRARYHRYLMERYYHRRYRRYHHHYYRHHYRR